MHTIDCIQKMNLADVTSPICYSDNLFFLISHDEWVVEVTKKLRDTACPRGSNLSIHRSTHPKVASSSFLTITVTIIYKINIILHWIRLKARKQSDLCKQVVSQLSAGHGGYCLLAHWNMTSHDSVLISPTVTEAIEPAGCPHINVLTLSDSSLGLCQRADPKHCFECCGLGKCLRC